MEAMIEKSFLEKLLSITGVVETVAMSISDDAKASIQSASDWQITISTFSCSDAKNAASLATHRGAEKTPATTPTVTLSDAADVLKLKEHNVRQSQTAVR